MSSPSAAKPDSTAVAMNLRRIMARDDLTFEEVVSATGLDERTVRALARATHQPHARTLHKLAAGLGISVDELFRPPSRFSPRQFDVATNSLVERVAARHAKTFQGWGPAEFEELYSRFGTGGQLTEAGVLAAADAMNAKRDLWRQIGTILESGEAEMLAEFVAMLYRRVTLRGSPDGAAR